MFKPLNRSTTVKVTNVEAADRHLGYFIDSKLDRGYRLRVVPKKEDGTLEVSAHGHLQLDMAIRFLKDTKFYIKEIPFLINDLAKQ